MDTLYVAYHHPAAGDTVTNHECSELELQKSHDVGIQEAGHCRVHSNEQVQHPWQPVWVRVSGNGSR